MNITFKPHISNNMVRWLLQARKLIVRKPLLDTTITKPNNKPINVPKPYVKATYDGLDVYSINTNSEIHIIFLHGGAYHNPLMNMHFTFMKDLHKQGQYNVHIIDYPLLPEGTVDVTVPKTLQTIRLLMKDKQFSSFYLSGDSAGGGLALSLAQHFSVSEIQKLLLISPWVDVSTTNEGIGYLEKKDPILSVKGLQKCGNEYALHRPKDPVPSPLYDDNPLPHPIHIYTGTHDILLPDILKYEYIHTDTILTIFHKGVHCCSIIPHTQAYKETIKDMVKHIS